MSHAGAASAAQAFRRNGCPLRRRRTAERGAALNEKVSSK
jgi:hypothetical protein